MTMRRVIGLLVTVIGCLAVAFLIRPTPARSLQLDLDAPDAFVSRYFPTATTSTNASLSIEDSLRVVAKGKQGEWQMGCEQISLDPGPDNERWLRYFGDPMPEAETLRLAVAICHSLEIPSTDLTNWYHRRGTQVLEASSCFQSGEYQGRYCEVEIRNGLTESPTLRLIVTIEI